MKGWIEKKLGDTELLKIIDGDRGKNYPSQTDFLAEGHCLFLNTKNVRPDGFNFDSTMFIDKDKDNELRKGKLERRDVILTTRGTIGNIAIYDDSVEFDNVRINSGMLIFRPNEHIITSEYLFKVLLAPIVKSQITQYTSGAAQPQLPIKTLVNFKIPVPPLSEQKRIVSIVDEAFEAIDIAIDNTKQNLTNTCELFDSIISTVIFDDSLKDGWHSKTVADVILTKKGSMRTGPFGSQLLHSEFVDEGIAVLGIDNAVKNEFQWDRRRFITPEKYLQLSRYKVNPGDVLITIMGTCGRCAIVPDDIPVAINTKHLCCITLDKQKCLPGFLHAYFLYHPIAQQFLLKKAKGSIMAGLNMEIIKELPLQLPSIPTQQKIIEEVRSLSHETQRLKTTYQQKLTALNELKQSILHKAFTGELTADKADLKTNIEPEAIAV